MAHISTDQEYWDGVRGLLPEFLSVTYDNCSGWNCGVPAKSVLKRFQSYVFEKSDRKGGISFHTFYNELRRLGYDLPVVSGYDVNTRVKGIALKERASL